MIHSVIKHHLDSNHVNAIREVKHENVPAKNRSAKSNIAYFQRNRLYLISRDQSTFADTQFTYFGVAFWIRWNNTVTREPLNEKLNVLWKATQASGTAHATRRENDPASDTAHLVENRGYRTSQPANTKVKVLHIPGSINRKQCRTDSYSDRQVERRYCISNLYS